MTKGRNIYFNIINVLSNPIQEKNKQTFLSKTSARIPLALTNFHMEMLKMAEDSMERCCPETATTVTMLKNARTKWYDGCTANGQDTETHLLTVSFTTWKVSPIEKHSSWTVLTQV